jgi:CubicO group peptidase (beta-lactamase class C family)
MHRQIRQFGLVGLICLLAGSFVCSDDVALTSLVADADALLQNRLPADAPGAAVLVVTDGVVRLQKGYGLADVQNKKPITAQTNFDLASVAKQFTAMAIMILADRGKLKFDDDVRKHLPELPIFDSTRPVRVQHLLHHTSGIPDYLDIWKGSGDEFRRLTNADVLRLLAKQKLKFATGSKHQYSNSNYVLLALIVQRVSGQSCHRFMNDAILKPLGMKNSVWFDDLRIAVPNRAIGYERKDGNYLPTRNDCPVNGDGGLFSNLEDLARWDAALAQGKLVKKETLQLAFTPGKLTEGECDYGFGWRVQTRDGKRVVDHNGSWNGTRTYLGRWIDERITIVVLSNNETVNAQRLANEVAAVFRKQ